MYPGLAHNPDFFPIFFASYFMILIFMIGLNLIADWVLFSRAGISGLWSIIPFCNLWQKIKIGKGLPSILLFLLFFVPGANALALIIMNYRFAKAYTRSEVIAILYVLFPFVVGLILAFSRDFTYRNPIDGGPTVM
ncbi:MAG: DUF5684 domain-containing protein [Bacillota bacterium]|nr:DUF5684 domain-containing protein [Bacillota bacterium]